MKTANSILKIFLVALLLAVQVHFAYAQTAALLPVAPQQFFDKNGNPVTSGSVGYYIPGTSTPKMVWQDDSQTTPWTNPITLNAGGWPPNNKGIYGNGTYRQIIKDKYNNIISDQPTSATGTGGGAGTSVGDGNSVGTILAWSGMIAPNQYQFAYGQALSRATYPELFQALTLLTNITCIGGNATITGIADTSNIPVGAAIESNCTVAGSTVVSKTINTVTLSVAANISTTVQGRFFPYGNGNGTTTFNTPDLRGRVIPGRTNMGGVTASNLTSTYYGSSPDATGAIGGNQSYVFLQNNLPNVNFNVSIPSGQGSHTHGVSGGTIGGTFGGTGAGPTTSFVANPTNITINSATLPSMTGTAASGGSGTAFSLVQPSITLNYIIKVTPDTSISGLFGVASIGGMQGIIACGSTLTCAGNIINVAAGGAAGANTQVQFNNSDALAGSPSLTWISPKLTIGANGSSTGQIALSGTTSGALTQTVDAIAGTPVVTWGNSTGTPAVTTSSPLAINTTTGNLTLGTVPVAQGGTNCTTASGVCLDNITDFSGTGFLTRTGAGAYAFQSATNGIVNSNLAQAGAATLKGNPTASTANVQDFTIQGLGQNLSVDAANDKLLIYQNSTGLFKYATPSQIATGGGGGTPGGTNGQVQFNNAGVFGGFTASGDATINTSTGAVNISKIQGVPVNPTGAATNDVLAYNGTTFVKSGLISLLNTVCGLSPSTCTSLFGYTYTGWYGLACDGVTDDTVKLQAAITGTPSGGVLYIQPSALLTGGCLIKTTTTVGAVTYNVIVNHPISIKGNGHLSWIKTDASIASTVVNIYVPVSAVPWDGVTWSGFQLSANGTPWSRPFTRVGDKGIWFDATTGGPSGFSNLRIRNIMVGESGNNYSIVLDGVSSTLNKFSNNVIWGGIRLNKVADSNILSGNQFAGTSGFGIRIDCSAGVTVAAGQCLLVNNNITNSGGTTIDGGLWVGIYNNYFEEIGSTSYPRVAMLDIPSASLVVNGTMIFGNIFANAVSATSLAIQIGTNGGGAVPLATYIGNNYFGNTNARTPINNFGSGTICAGMNVWPSTVHVAGTGTLKNAIGGTVADCP